MELDDCAFPLLAGIEITDDPKVAFDGCNVGLLVGARPRGPGMERADLLEANGGIFKPQGEAINAGAADDIKVLVVGNPANTNCADRAVARARRPERALHRDDAPRPQPGDLPARRPSSASTVTDDHEDDVWGNHSPTQYPDLVHAEVGGKTAPGGGRRSRAGSRRVHPDASPSAAPRSSTPAAPRARPRPRTPRSTTSTTGCSAPPTATGSRWACPRRLLRHRRGDHLRPPLHLLGRRVLDRRGPRDRRLLAPADRRRASTSCAASATRSASSACSSGASRRRARGRAAPRSRHRAGPARSATGRAPVRRRGDRVPWRLEACRAPFRP